MMMVEYDWKHLTQTIVIHNASIEYKIMVHVWNKPKLMFYHMAGKMEEYRREMEQWEKIMGWLRWERAVLRTD